MPPHHLRGAPEDFSSVDTLFAQAIDHAIVKAQKSKLKLGDEQMRIVARVADDGEALFIARQVTRLAAVMTYEELIRVMNVVEIRLTNWSGAIKRFKIEAWRAEILQNVYIFGLLQRCSIMGDVVGNKLPEEGPTCGDFRVVFSKAFLNTAAMFNRATCGAVF